MQAVETFLLCSDFVVTQRNACQTRTTDLCTHWGGKKVVKLVIVWVMPTDQSVMLHFEVFTQPARLCYCQVEAPRCCENAGLPIGTGWLLPKTWYYQQNVDYATQLPASFAWVCPLNYSNLMWLSMRCLQFQGGRATIHRHSLWVTSARVSVYRALLLHLPHEPPLWYLLQR